MSIYRAIITLFFLCMIFCNCTDASLRKEYTGYWAETKFTYQFEGSGKFKFITEGHFGNTVTKGEYAKIESIILRS